MKRVFLVGCPRSGTTLLQSMIARNSRVFTLPETSFFLHLYGDYVQRFYGIESATLLDVLRENYRSIRNRFGVANKTPSLVLADMYRNAQRPVPLNLQRVRRWRLQEAVDTYVKTLDSFAKSEDCECWLEKTPGHFAYIPDIKMRIENVYFVHVVRSPLENIASLKDAARRFPDVEAWKPFANLDICIDVWRRSAEAAIECAGEQRHFIVDYDDVAAHPEAAIAAIEAWLTIPRCESIDNETRRLRAAKKMVTSSEPWKAGVFSKIESASKVKSALRGNEVSAVQSQLDKIWQDFSKAKLAL